MSLNIKYLPNYHYKEIHRLKVVGTAEEIMSAILSYQTEDDFFFRWAIALREIPARLFSSTDQLISQPPFSFNNFTLLEQTSHEVAFGLVGQFWKKDYGQIPISDAESFLAFTAPDNAKLVLYFKLDQDHKDFYITTETRILCLSSKSLAKFRPYWYLIRPISGIIRYRLLRQIQKNVYKSK